MYRKTVLLFAVLLSLAWAINAQAGMNEELFKMVRLGYVDGVKELILKGADVNAKDEDGQTPLHIAILSYEKEVAEFLISKGADVNAKDEGGRTPLYWAASFSEKEVSELFAKLLISKGADVNAKDKFGRTPLKNAEESGHTDLADFMREHGGPSKKREEFDQRIKAISEYSGASERKNIIKLALSITPPPAIPEEARESLTQGFAVFKTARNRTEFRTAEKHFKKARDLAPWWADAYLNLALTQEKLRDYNNAIENLDLYLIAAPDTPETGAVKGKKAELKILKERHEKAFEIVKEAAGSKGFHATDIEADPYKFISMLTEAIKTDPDWGYPHAQLGWIYVLTKDWAKAVSESEEAIRLEWEERPPGQLFAFNHIALGYYNLGNSTKAILALEEGLRVDPYGHGSAYAHKNLGKYYEAAGNYQKSLEHFETADVQNNQFDGDPDSRSYVKKSINRVKGYLGR